MPKKDKAQAALEYGLTYAWALILIAILASVLVFVSSGNLESSSSCTNFMAFICKGVGADGDTLVLILQNASGQKVTINPFLDISFDNQEGYAVVNYLGEDYRFEDVTIDKGDQFTITARGKALAKEISITYIERRTGLKKTVTSKIRTGAPENIELSNDGIDNDGDGLTDCNDPDVQDCEYINEFDSITDTVIQPGKRATLYLDELKDPSGNPINGCWRAGAISLSFYVESLDPGTQGALQVVNPGIALGQTIDLTPGWNTINVFVDETHPDAFWGTNIHDFELYAKPNTNGFTINNSTKTPKPVWAVKATDPSNCP